MIHKLVLYTLIFSNIIFASCQNNDTRHLQQVSVEDFSEFVNETNYKTDAEKFGWSFIQVNVFEFYVEYDINWRIPNGVDSAKLEYPVTQVSFNDAIAYCMWAKTRLPSYKEYWKLAQQDAKAIIKNDFSVYPIDQVNIIGNVWEITRTENDKSEIRLAGGSYLCNDDTCKGTSPERINFIDKTTGNINIGFAVIKV